MYIYRNKIINMMNLIPIIGLMIEWAQVHFDEVTK